MKFDEPDLNESDFQNTMLPDPDEKVLILPKPKIQETQKPDKLQSILDGVFHTINYVLFTIACYMVCLNVYITSHKNIDIHYALVPVISLSLMALSRFIAYYNHKDIDVAVYLPKQCFLSIKIIGLMFLYYSIYNFLETLPK